MQNFSYRHSELFIEDVSVLEVARRFGTPCYVYSKTAIEQNWLAFDQAFKEQSHLICYAVKANSNLTILKLLAQLGSGFDIVSLGELERVLKAGGAPEKIVFSGVGKRRDEMQRALEVGIHCFNVESQAELERLNQVAMEIGIIAPISLRVNPDVDAGTHPYISTGLKENKFGIDINQALDVYLRAMELSHVEIVGVDCHIGSQLTDTSPFVSALERVLNLIDRLEARGIRLKHLDIGGGLGISYRDEVPPPPAAYAQALLSSLNRPALKIILEPGRAIVGNAGALLTTVEYIKPGELKNFAIIDAAMNDLIRPTLYSAWQNIIPAYKKQGDDNKRRYDVVGPVCETGDFLGKDRDLIIEQGDLLAVCSAGAYGFSMSSNYNTRPRSAEVLIAGENTTLIRRRETIEELFAAEIDINVSVSKT